MLHNAKISEMLLIQRGNLVAVDIYRIAEKIEPENSGKKPNRIQQWYPLFSYALMKKRCRIIPYYQQA